MALGNFDVDALAAGGGMAGLCAAIAAAEAGASVGLLEAGPALGGSMALSNGNFTSFTSPELARKLAHADDRALQQLVSGSLPRDLGWLSETV